MRDDFVTGVLSIHVPDQVWRNAVETAVRIATKTRREGGVAAASARTLAEVASRASRVRARTGMR